MPTFQRHHCRVCRSDHYEVTDDDERNLWIRLGLERDMAPEEKEGILEVLRDRRAALDCDQLAEEASAVSQEYAEILSRIIEQQRDLKARMVNMTEKLKDGKETLQRELDKNREKVVQARRQCQELRETLDQRHVKEQWLRDEIQRLRDENERKLATEQQLRREYEAWKARDEYRKATLQQFQRDTDDIETRFEEGIITEEEFQAEELAWQAKVDLERLHSQQIRDGICQPDGTLNNDIQDPGQDTQPQAHLPPSTTSESTRTSRDMPPLSARPQDESS
ncbi:uncharacterized protein BDZ99DRAFT_570462 [Mytilinidion resinicola]|uniref:Uncharacterized protein n=1 Tax=Mytilinidion resinicola TaxID=574789 RepID=A0A6A6YTC6_9PEZI|nr:uncharacterized protein BDZ99DRAFT_570462 [Mytilinidion resinicola]KAF2811215.1 hypothetical protein BDZ99DRAFT_570462 [Mytilinidion resinicola]